MWNWTSNTDCCWSFPSVFPDLFLSSYFRDSFKVVSTGHRWSKTPHSFKKYLMTWPDVQDCFYDWWCPSPSCFLSSYNVNPWQINLLLGCLSCKTWKKEETLLRTTVGLHTSESKDKCWHKCRWACLCPWHEEIPSATRH